jgi:hypothetical protein
MGTIHSSLDDATPEEFAESFKEQKPLAGLSHQLV